MNKTSTTVVITGESLTIDEIQQIISNPKATIEVSSRALKKVAASFAFLNKNLKNNIVYGINTGFGPMASHILAPNQLLDLQANLIRSHAVGMGDPIDQEFVLAAMVVRLNTISKGLSGVSPELIARLQQFINLRIIPVIPEHGAVGTSGDLVQLAHIALAIMGEGEVYYNGKRQLTAQLLKKFGIVPYTFKPKEGLAMINGTSVMSGIGAVLVNRSQRALDLNLRAGALALELVQSFDDGISEALSAARPHPGQIAVAKTLRSLLSDSTLLKNRQALFKDHEFKDDVEQIPQTVQEIYSLRCMPQILGPIYDTIELARTRLAVEINSATDNPLVMASERRFLHGGNFHGDYISHSLDQLKIVMVKLTMLAERQINFFLNVNVNKFLPPFLNLNKPGLTLALQGLQFVATSTTAHNQTLAFPQYVHSISTNADNQDIVSMGTDAALIASRVIDNSFIVLAIEGVVMAQAVDVLKIAGKISSQSKVLYKFIRSTMPVIAEDKVIYPQLQSLVQSLKTAVWNRN